MKGLQVRQTRETKQKWVELWKRCRASQGEGEADADFGTLTTWKYLKKR